MSGVFNHQPVTGRQGKGTGEGRNLPPRQHRGYLAGPTSAFRISYGIMRLQVCSINPPYTVPEDLRWHAGTIN